MFEIGFETMLSLKCLSFVPKICCKCSDNFWNCQIFRENLLNWKFGELKWDSNWELSTSCRTNVKLLVEYHPLLLPFLLPPKKISLLCVLFPNRTNFSSFYIYENIFLYLCNPKCAICRHKMAHSLLRITRIRDRQVSCNRKDGRNHSRISVTWFIINMHSNHLSMNRIAQTFHDAWDVPPQPLKQFQLST